MAITANHFMSAILMLIVVSLDFAVAQIGVCYGRLGDDLPCASDVVKLYKQYNIKRMRIYDPDKPTLEALCGSDIELTVGVRNEDIENIAACQDNADTWVQHNIKQYPNVRFTHIVIGNEISPAKADTSQYAPYVLSAMQNIYTAVCAGGLGDQIKVSTGVDTGVLNNSYPPQNGDFRCDVTSYINPIIRFLLDTNAPLFVSIYPYFAYRDDKQNIKLSYALLEPNSAVNASGVIYDNLFYAIVDAMYAAMEKSIGGSSLDNIRDGRRLQGGSNTPDIKGSETGWSSRSTDAIESVEHARIYNNNVVQIVKKGTPKRPGQPIETYIFAMFDENQKPGPDYERHFGLFRPNGQPKYPMNFN